MWIAFSPGDACSLQEVVTLDRILNGPLTKHGIMTKESSHRRRRSVEKDPFHKAQDFAAAVGLTCLIFGLAVGLCLARLAGWGCSP